MRGIHDEQEFGSARDEVETYPTQFTLTAVA